MLKLNENGLNLGNLLPKREVIDKSWLKEFRASISEETKLTRAKLYCALNKGKRLGVLHDVTYLQLHDLFLKTGGVCKGCGNIPNKGLTLDHIYPFKRSLTSSLYTIKGLQFLCMGCNRLKFTSLMSQFEIQDGQARITDFIQ